MSITDRLDQIEGRNSWANSTLTARHMLVGKDVPDMLAALRAVLDLHKREYWEDENGHTGIACERCSRAFWVRYPCETVLVVTDALGEDS